MAGHDGTKAGRLRVHSESREDGATHESAAGLSETADAVAPLIIYRPGTVVLIGGPGHSNRSHLIEARIVNVMIAGSVLHVRYAVAWYEGSARLEDWVEPEEIISAGPAEDVRIGFTS